MGMHLEDIAFQVAPGAHDVLIFDQAGCHASAAMMVLANTTLLALSPKCPDRQPSLSLAKGEHVWQFMRSNWLSSRIFTSYDDIADHC